MSTTTNTKRIRVIDLLVAASVVGMIGWYGMRRPGSASPPPATFAQELDLSPLHRVAVHADGRLRSFESHAKTYMGYVAGPRTINGQSNTFTYLDLMLRPQRYQDVDLIYIKSKQLRAQVVEALRDDPAMTPDRAAGINRSGLISRTLLARPEVIDLMQRLGQDLIRTAKAVDAVQSGLTVADPRFLIENLRLIAPPTGDVNKPWLSIGEISAAIGAPADDMHAGLHLPKNIPGLDPALQTKLADAWSALQTAWRAEDVTAANTQITTLAGLLPTVAPSLYPAPGRLGMESWYFRNQSMTWVWLMYLAAVAPLLMAVVYRWDGARKAGIALFLIAFIGHTASLGVRWYISGRWPNSNMFEAVTTAAWFGGVLAVILERIARNTPLRNLFALGSALMSMAALMAAYFLPAQLDSAINNKMAALNDVWLYIHTNVIIWSYAVIGIACVPALLYLRNRWCALWDSGLISKARLLVLPLAAGVLNYTGYVLLMHMLDDPSRELSQGALLATGGAFWGAMMIILLEGLAARSRRLAGVTVERAASGGASSLMAAAPSAQSFLRAEKPSTGQVYDGATMILVELSFVMLWAGIVMGAIWADHSWGRPWGWDPKEVFALNTFLIFLILIHVRLKVRDRGFWTAVLAVIGFEVMMFNWIVVNFVITGLHSYA